MARTRSSDPIATGAHLQGEMFRNKMSVPNEHDVDAQLFSDIAKAAGEKPRGGAALASGIFKGLEHGAKSKSVGKRQEEADKYDKVMNYLTEANNAAVERTEWYETREKAREEFLPQVVSYMDNIDRLDPQSRQIMAQNILTGYGNALGEDYKLKSIDGANPFVVTLETKKGTQVMDLRTLFAGDELMQQKIAMKMPEYQLKLQQEREDKQQKFDLEQQKVDIQQDYIDLERENAPLKYETQQRRIDETARRNDNMAIKADTTLVKTLGKQVDASKDFLTRVPELKEIVTKNPDIFQSAVDAIWRENKEPGFINNMIKSVQNTWNKDKVTAFTVLVKDINKMTLDVTNGIAQPNQFIEKIGSKAVPNLDMNAEGFLKALDTMAKEKNTSLQNNLKRMEILEQQENKPLSKQYRDSANQVLDTQNEDSSDWSDIGQLVK